MFINFAKDVAANFVSVGSRKSSGLSVLEILASIAVAGVLAGIAVPAYQAAVEKRQLSNAAEQVSFFLNSVRSEAVQRNRRVLVSFEGLEDGRWCLGATLGRLPCDCSETVTTEPDSCRLGSSDRVLRDSDVQTGNLLVSASGDGHFTMDPVRGLPIDANDRTVIALQTENLAYEIQIQLSASGRVFICQAEDSKQISPYKQCSPSAL